MSSHKIIDFVTPKDKEPFQSNKEYQNLQGYYLSLKCLNDQINITSFNLDLLDGIKYIFEININQLYKKNQYFKSFYNIVDIYKEIIRLIDDNKYKITKNEKYLVFSLIITNNNNNDDEINFTLINSGKFNNEYTNILLKEIKRLRNDNKIINELKEENNNLKKEIEKLKNNKKREFLSIEEFNKKFNLKLNNYEKELKLFNQGYNDEIVEYLCKLDLKNLKKLYLSSNDINNLRPFEMANCENLEFFIFCVDFPYI